MSTALPVRRYAENTNGVYYKVNSSVTVIDCARGARLCCLTDRSNTCEHVRAVERFIAAGEVESAA